MSIGESTAFALTDEGQILAWGGCAEWWVEKADEYKARVVSVCRAPRRRNSAATAQRISRARIHTQRYNPGNVTERSLMMLGHGQVAKYEDELDSTGAAASPTLLQRLAAAAAQAFSWTDVSVAAEAATESAALSDSVPTDAIIPVGGSEASETTPTKREKKHKHARMLPRAPVHHNLCACVRAQETSHCAP